MNDGIPSMLRRRLALRTLPPADREELRTAAATIETFELMMRRGETGRSSAEEMLHKRQGIYEGIIRDLVQSS